MGFRSFLRLQEEVVAVAADVAAQVRRSAGLQQHCCRHRALRHGPISAGHTPGVAFARLGARQRREQRRESAADTFVRADVDEVCMCALLCGNTFVPRSLRMSRVVEIPVATQQKLVQISVGTYNTVVWCTCSFPRRAIPLLAPTSVRGWKDVFPSKAATRIKSL